MSFTMFSKMMQGAVLSAVFATAGFAAGANPTATLKAPTNLGEQVVDDVIWHCDGTACRVVSAGRVKVTARACHQVEKTFGPVAAFGTPTEQLSAADLDTCNQ